MDAAAVDDDFAAVGEDGAAEDVAEVGADEIVVIPLDIDNLRAAFAQLAQRFEEGNIRGEDDVAVAEPELEDIAQQVKGADLSPLLAQKGQEALIVVILRIEEMGVGEKDILHGRAL